MPSSPADLDLKFKSLANPKHQKNKSSNVSNSMAQRMVSFREDLKAQKAKEKKAVAAAVQHFDKITKSPEHREQVSTLEPEALCDERKFEPGAQQR